MSAGLKEEASDSDGEIIASAVSSESVSVEQDSINVDWRSKIDGNLIILFQQNNILFYSSTTFEQIHEIHFYDVQYATGLKSIVYQNTSYIMFEYSKGMTDYAMRLINLTTGKLQTIATDLHQPAFTRIFENSKGELCVVYVNNYSRLFLTTYVPDGLPTTSNIQLRGCGRLKITYNPIQIHVYCQSMGTAYFRTYSEDLECTTDLTNISSLSDMPVEFRVEEIYEDSNYIVRLQWDNHVETQPGTIQLWEKRDPSQHFISEFHFTQRYAWKQALLLNMAYKGDDGDIYAVVPTDVRIQVRNLNKNKVVHEFDHRNQNVCVVAPNMPAIKSASKH